VTGGRGGLHGAIPVSLVAVVAVTLLPTGSGWAWGAPLAELRWYASGLDSGATLLQLTGNLGLLVVPAALAVLAWPRLGRPLPLALAAVSTGAAIELLQWSLPLGRVVSPVDAALNALGAVAAGLAVAALRSRARRVRRAA
jgi:glycopeptide antibiotics resistance protein